jgi:hypothetical protein
MVVNTTNIDFWDRVWYERTNILDKLHIVDVWDVTSSYLVDAYRSLSLTH